MIGWNAFISHEVSTSLRFMGVWAWIFALFLAYVVFFRRKTSGGLLGWMELLEYGSIAMTSAIMP